MGWDEIRRQILETATSVAELSHRIGNEDLDRPALGTWDVRGLSGHLLRAMRTPVLYLGEIEPRGEALPSAASYFAQYLEWRSSDPGGADARVASRGAAEISVTSAAQLQDEFETSVDALHTAIATAPDRLVPSAFGPMWLADYVRTRTLEMVVHGLDLANALDEVWDPPADALGDVLALCCEITIVTGKGTALLLELTGRRITASVLPVLR